MGIRTALEEATMRLIAHISKLDPEVCMTQRTDTIPDLPAEQLRGRALRSSQQAGSIVPVAPQQPSPATSLAPSPAPVPIQSSAGTGAAAASLNSGNPATTAAGGAQLQIAFEFGDADFRGGAQATLDQIVAQVASGPVDVMLVARDAETWDASTRDRLLDKRIAAVIMALGNRGIGAGGIQVTWRPDSSDSSIHRDGPGMQEIARIRVNR